MASYPDIYKELKKIRSAKTFKNEPLSRHTTLKIGGPADVLVIPKDIEALQKILNITSGIKKYIIGNGSNLLISDRGLRGLVIKISGGVNNFGCNGRFVTVGAGTLLQPFIRKLATLGLSGLEFSAWIPAAIGGAVTLNMGAFGEELGDIVEYADILDPAVKIKRLSRSDLKFSYRKSNIKNCILISAMLKLNYRQKHIIKQRMDEIISKRKELQPMSVPSAGSIFRNPKDVPAGKLIDMAGCKGLRIGGAEISKKHANFIINLGDAKASDVKTLISKVKNVVKEKFKVTLELELVDSSKLNMLF
ncbi:MAG: UDP-N-acetylmuramate dehydrogenase [bacterium]